MLETYLKDLEEVVNIDCGSNTCDGVTRVAEIMKRHYDEIGFATELVDLGDKAGRGLFATNKPGAEKFDIMFNAHLDTVYPDGTVAQRPFRVAPAAPSCAPARVAPSGTSPSTALPLTQATTRRTAAPPFSPPPGSQSKSPSSRTSKARARA